MCNSVHTRVFIALKLTLYDIKFNQKVFFISAGQLKYKFVLFLWLQLHEKDWLIKAFFKNSSNSPRLCAMSPVSTKKICNVKKLSPSRSSALI